MAAQGKAKIKKKGKNKIIMKRTTHAASKWA
jgi:hypothetical protein